MKAIKDLIIIGGGPAGITAAIYAARKKLDLSIITGDIGGQAAWSGDVENYTGWQFISGPELAQKFRQHLEQFKFNLHEQDEVKSIRQINGGFEVLTASSLKLSSKTLIIASGKRPRMLGVPGEEKFKNRGVMYCATCDGPLFSGKDVAVIGGGNSALDAALQMMNIASRVYLINVGDKLTGDAVMADKVRSSSKVEIINSAKTLEILGDKFVNAVRIGTKDGVRDLSVKGIFVEIGLLPNSDFIDIVEKNKSGEIIINCSAETSAPGIFAAGDVTDVPEKQIIIAAGDGAKASLSAFRYLSTH